MSEPFIGEIQMFGGNFAPRGWAFCNGQLLPISQNTALFSILGTTYGGNGRETFGLPELRGRAPMHRGSGPGLTPRALGQNGGSETVTLQAAQLPTHTHVLGASSNDNQSGTPVDGIPGVSEEPAYRSNANTTMAPDVLMATGGGQPHDNMQPYLALSFIIALVGIYPSRN